MGHGSTFGTGILDDILGGGQGKANAFNDLLLEQMNALFAEGRGEAKQYGALARGDLMRALLAGTEGVDRAKGEVGRLGDSARANIGAANDQAVGQIEKRLLGSGLSAGSAGVFAERGVASDTARALADVDATLAQMYSNLEVMQGQGEAGAFTGMANVNMGVGQQVAGSMQTQGMNLSNYFAQGGQSILSLGADTALGFAGFKSLFG